MQSDKHLRKLAALRGLRGTTFVAALAERALPHSQLYADLNADSRKVREVEALTSSLWDSLEQAFRRSAQPVGQGARAKPKSSKDDHRQRGAGRGGAPAQKSGGDELSKAISLYIERIDRLIEGWKTDDTYGAILACTQLELAVDAWISLAEAQKLRSLTDRLPKSAGAVAAAQSAIGGVLNYLQLGLDDAEEERFADDEAMVEWLDAHETMQAEIAFHNEIRRLLDAPVDVVLGNLASVRALAHNDGVSSIGISLDAESADSGNGEET